MFYALIVCLLFLQPETVYPAQAKPKPKPKVQQKWRRTQVTYREPSRPSRSREEYVHFSRETEKVIAKMNEVATNGRERDDLQVIQFSLNKFNEAINAGNYEEADRIRDSMKASLARGGGVAAVAEKRKSDRARAEAERRHQEALAQQRRQHQEMMMEIYRQRADQLRFR